MAHRLRNVLYNHALQTTQHIEQPDLVTAIPQTSNHGAPDARADPCGFPALREHRRIRCRAASPAFALANTVSGFSRHARAIVKAHDIESRLRQRGLILALVPLLACPPFRITIHRASWCEYKSAMFNGLRDQDAPVGPATIERSISSRPRQQQSTRLRGEALPHGIVAGQPTQHVICRPNAARGLVVRDMSHWRDTAIPLKAVPAAILRGAH